MERRTFLNIVGGMGIMAQPFPDQVPDKDTTQGLMLTAFAAEHLPHTAMLYGYTLSEPGSVFEIRRYQGSLPSPQILSRHGIKPILANESAILVSFADLARRDRAWNAVTADPEWQANRRDVTQISLYRMADPRETPLS
jgi:hypothetical protein